MTLPAGQITVGLVIILLFLNVPTSNAQPGFISIDCGASTSYTDANSIDWVPDTGYILTGANSGNVTVGIYKDPPYKTLRYFPEGRNKFCYILNATFNDTYLIRSRFLYGMYDGGSGGNRYPEFDLTIDANLVGGVFPDATNTVATYDTIVVAVSSNIYVCLEPHSPHDVPFINSLELRSLGPASLYYPLAYQNCYLNNRNRWNFGYGNLIRYPQDKFDRKWYGYGTTGASVLSTPHLVDTSNGTLSRDLAPTAVLQTAQTWPLTQNFTYSFNISVTGNYMVWLWWAEIDPQASNKTRSMLLSVTGAVPNNPVNIANITGGMYMAYEYGYSNHTLTPSTTMTLSPTPDSQLGVMLNALEVYRLSDPLVPRTYPSDAMAIESIKTSLNLSDWTGDPCLHHPYDWIKCTSDAPPRISALKLANYNLSGPIPASIANLTALNILIGINALIGIIPDLSALTGLQQLHLQNNLLSGRLPEWLATLTGLSELLVQNNNFSGPVPDSLKGKSNFTFQYFPGNTFLCVANASACNALPPSSPTVPGPSPSPNKSSSSVIPIVVGCAVGGLVLIACIGLLLCFFVRRRKKGVDPQPALPTYDKERNGAAPRPTQGTGNQTKPYTLAEVKAATDNFSTQIGEGGFGPVYKGLLPNGQLVAVKKCSPSNRHGITEFLNEVDLLSRVHHRNLVYLVGYCQEGQEQILIYEYMPMGNLREHVHADALNSKTPLSWNQRLHIALDSAQGLEYLHTGCSPSIIHRDVKTSNILLSDRMVAKVADFGLSKLTNSEIILPQHVSTEVKGTAGYLDPEYLTSRHLTDKSDVYSFGVVLLELICGRPPIDRTRYNSDQAILIAWVRPQLEAANLRNVMDPALGNSCNIESMWKVAETAMLCVEPSGVNRPSMTHVVQELRDAIAMEERLSYKSNDYSVASSVSDPNIPNSGLVVARNERSGFEGHGFGVSGTYSDRSGPVGRPMPR